MAEDKKEKLEEEEKQDVSPSEEEGLEEELRQELQKEKVSNLKKAKKLIATRDQLEEDFKKATITVELEIKKGQKRYIKARKMNGKEFREYLDYITKASELFAGSMETVDEKQLAQLKKIYTKAPEICAKFSADESLNEEFWENYTGIDDQFSFINQVSAETQSSQLTEEDIQNFR